LSHVVNRLFGTYIGIHDETGMLHEHRLVFDHLILGNAEGAEIALRHHPDEDHSRARSRLKVLSVFGNPEIAPYLSRVH
jgi:DNA-binding GntR family transcriptional regulator